MSSARDIDRICDLFEAEWKSRKAPNLSFILSTIPESDHSAFLSQLIPIDIEYRIQNVERPSAGLYAQLGDSARQIAELQVSGHNSQRRT